MEMILFRHSTAEKWEDCIDDFSRELTDKGRWKAKTKADLLKKEISPDKNLIVWFSPLTRAVQTAQIICESLSCENKKQKEYIAGGELSLLTKNLQTRSNDDLIIIVGHAPYLDNWCEKITGRYIKLRKSGFVWITISSLNPLSGEIKQINNDKE